MAKMHSFHCCFLLLSLSTLLTQVAGFVTTPKPPVFCGKHVVLYSEDGSSDESSAQFEPTEIFPEAEFKEFSLLPHRPLGMTVEESLADKRFVLVTKVVEGGHASAAGIATGDVLVGITGLFGDVTNVIGLEVDKIKGMVGSRPEDEALEIKVARGTEAFDAHEKVVIELCANESSDKEVEQCLVDYLATDYNNLNKAPVKEEECDLEDPDADCLVDNLLGMWAEDLPPPPPTPTEDSSIEQPPETVKPWSSRSSGSGTFVRDPATGEMKNIG